MPKINWDSIVGEVQSSLRDFFEPRGIKPTLRTVFYRMYSLGHLPNTRSGYQGLIKAMVKARKDEIIPFDAFNDGAKRGTIGNYHDGCADPIEDAQEWVNYIRQLKEEQTYKIGRWYRQPHYVEVWIEKDALASTFLSFLRDRGVRIAVNKGYSSWTFLYENIQRLQAYVDDGKKVHILYFGDFDPSGIDMETGHLQNALEYFGLADDVHFERIGVTLEQIQQYNLPEMPDTGETVEKARRDPRYTNFIVEHGRLILVEVDAMLALVPDEFRDIIQQSVDQYFDEDIYEETRRLEEENAERHREYIDDHVHLDEDEDEDED